MLDIKLIRENPDKLKKKIASKGADPELIDKVIEADSKRRELLASLEQAQSDLNKNSSEIAKLHSQQKIDAIKEASVLSEKVKELKPQVDEASVEFKKVMLQIPNPPEDGVIEGKSDKENTVNRKWGEPTKFDFEPKDYLVLASELDLIDMERGSKIAGSRSYFLKNEVALLEFALIQYAMEILVGKGFVPMVAPVLLNRAVMEGAGYVPQGEDEIYKTQDNTYLAGTAEQPLAGYHMNEVLEEKKLPLRYAGFSTCFRREAGSYGKDVKGILRVHQFDKVEMFSYAKPEDSEKEHEYLVSIEEKIVQGLKLPYEVMNICAGDLGAPASKKFDINTWIPSENKYRETHSCSNCTDFQARRLNIRYKDKDGRVDFLHTLNGTGIAIPRIVIAILENYQQKDGSIKIPEVLQKYLSFKEIKR
ncbi:MAG: serine--tRNA ligase [Patescibacteria group bacterium]|nr:serine--tRNA ligase [Patescibacteria group bacterium]